MDDQIVTNDTLALRYRPLRLEELAGQEDVVAKLRGMFTKLQVPNAIMITGVSGIGKTTISRMIALYLNCATHDACGECSSCVSIIEKKTIPDYIEVNASDEGNIENIRQLIQSAKLRPRNRVRIIYLDEVHRLSLAAANALLKPLEEPPPQTLWILATTDPEKIPNSKAVCGRCTPLILKPPSKEQIAKRLKTIARAEKFKWLKQSGAEAIAVASAGHVRDAVQILESVSDHINGLKEVPRGKALVKLIEDLAIKTVSMDLDKVALSIILGIYTGDARRVQRNIINVDEYIGIVNKLLYINWFLLNRTVVDKHPKLWYTRVNGAAWKAIADKGIELDIDLTSEVHAALTALRSEMQNFAVGAEHLVSSRLTRLAIELFPEEDDEDDDE